MSAAGNTDEPDYSQAPTEGENLQVFPNASTPNQSDSPTASEKNDEAEVVEDMDPIRINRKRKAHTSCQICQVILKDEKPYYQRYRICRTCSSVDRTDDIDGLLKRFCQQCGRFQHITLFDGNMRTCRERLDRHAARRRKSHARQAAIRRGSPMEDDDPGRRDTYSPTPQRRQYNQSPRYHVRQLQSYHLQQHQQALPNPMLDLAHQNLHHPAAGHRTWAEQQRAIQHHQQEQQTLKHLLMSIASARPSPENLLNPLYSPRPLRFGPSPHPQSFVDPSAIDPTTAASKMKAVLAVLLNEAAAAAAPPPPPPPPPPPLPQQQNSTEALQSILQRLVAIATCASGGNGSEDRASPAAPAAAPSFAAAHPAINAVLANTIAPPTVNVADVPALNTTTTSTADADINNTTSIEFAGLSPPLPPEITELGPQLRAALTALMRYEEERGKPQQ
ncbi:hypothetical protein Ndes2437B_g02101 [Nannochloris sp. 'desiccata']